MELECYYTHLDLYLFYDSNIILILEKFFQHWFASIYLELETLDKH